MAQTPHIIQQVVRLTPVRFVEDWNNFSLNTYEEGDWKIEQADTFLKRKHEKLVSQLANQSKGSILNSSSKKAKAQAATKVKSSETSQKLFKYYENYEQRKTKLYEELKF